MQGMPLLNEGALRREAAEDVKFTQRLVLYIIQAFMWG